MPDTRTEPDSTTPRATVIALCARKGGVGKTTVTAGLADAMTRQGLRVLVIDADPQANLTDTVGITDRPDRDLNDVLAPTPPALSWPAASCRPSAALVTGGGRCTWSPAPSPSPPARRTAD